MDTGFKLAGFGNRSRSVSAKILLRSASFRIDRFLLALRQPIGFQPNGTQIRTHRCRKPLVTRPWCDRGFLEGRSPIPRNAVIPLAGNRGGLGGFIISGQKVALDLLLDERKIPRKFGFPGTYRVQMHSEQTNSLLYTYRLRRDFHHSHSEGVTKEEISRTSPSYNCFPR